MQQACGCIVFSSVMQACTHAVVVLFLVTTTLTNASLSDVPVVSVSLHDPAVLLCFARCSGLVTWTVFSKPSDPLAECNQTSCRSVAEGYHMIHDQYLQGNLSLIIREADFSKRGVYTCSCDGADLCDVRLQIQPLRTPVQIRPGGSLLLELDGSGPVRVIYSSSDGGDGSGGQICTADGHSLTFKEECKERFSLKSVLELRAMQESDSGVYTVRDSSGDEDVHVYAVTVRDAEWYPAGDNRVVVLWWVMISLGLVVTVLMGVCAVLMAVTVEQKKENVRLQKRIVRNIAEIKELRRPLLQDTDSQRRVARDVPDWVSRVRRMLSNP